MLEAKAGSWAWDEEAEGPANIIFQQLEGGR